MKRIRIVIYNLFITLLLLEVGLAVAGRMNWLPMDLPSYSLANVQPFWRDINPDFGVWHAPNTSYRHVKECFNVVYQSNRFGMRDAERSRKAGGPRVIMLGDSFIEGFGVERGDRMSNLLEAKTGIPHLNFGTSGVFGLTQSWLLYRSLASRFDHDAVIIGILPGNDFSDDDFAHGEKRHDDRYRPYLIGRYPGYEVKYFNKDRLTAPAKEVEQTFLSGFREFTHITKAFSYFKSYLAHVSAEPPLSANAVASQGGRRIDSKYYDFTGEEFNRMRYAIERISGLALPRPVLLVLIPRRSDYERARMEGGVPPLRQRLRQLSRNLGLDFIDLLERSQQRTDLDGLFYRCDPHWNAQGHLMAAGAVAQWGYYPKQGRK